MATRKRSRSLRTSISSFGEILTKTVGKGVKPPARPEEEEKRSFELKGAKVWCSEGWGRYEYADVRLWPVPEIVVSEPDNQPFTMDIHNGPAGILAETEPPPKAQPAKETETPPKKKKTPRVFFSGRLPPSPPDSPVSTSNENIVDIPEGLFDPPSRPPPPPPPPPRRGGVKSQLPPSPPSTPDSPTSCGSFGSTAPPQRYAEPPRRPPPPPPPAHAKPGPKKFPAPCITPPESPVLGNQAPEYSLTDLPYDLLYKIFTHLDDPAHMLAMAHTSSQLNRVFTKHNLLILRVASPCTYELLSLQKCHTSMPYASILRHHQHTISTYKRLIRKQCRYFLSPHLCDPIFPSEDTAFSDALTRIWTFCILFSPRPTDVDAQLGWLESQSLSLEELRNIAVVYNCINVLLRPLTLNVEKAIEAGVVARRGEEAKWEVMQDVERWTWFLQMRGLWELRPVVETEGEQMAWQVARIEGLLSWEGYVEGTDPRGFLKEAVQRASIEVGRRHQRRCEEVDCECPESKWGPTWESF